MTTLKDIELFLDKLDFCIGYTKRLSNDRVDFLIETIKTAFTLHYRDGVFMLHFPIKYFGDQALEIANSWNIEYGAFANLTFEQEDNTLFLSHLILLRNYSFEVILEDEMKIFLERILDLKQLLGE